MSSRDGTARIGLVENKRPSSRAFSPDDAITGREERETEPFFMAKTFPDRTAPRPEIRS